MIKGPYIIILLFLLTGCKLTQYVNNDMLEVPKQKLHYILDGEKKDVEVYPFYISTYPESNKQYKNYLHSLSSNDKANALPKLKFLKNSDLNKLQINFLIDEYYLTDNYDNYPVIGLNKEQIKRYLDWKTDKIGKEILARNKIEFNPDKTYLEIVREGKIKQKYLQVGFNVLLPEQAISARYYLKSKISVEKNTAPYNKSENDILKSLGIKEVGFYKIDKIRQTRELIYNQLDSITFYKSIHQKNQNTFEINQNSNILVPLRTWHIKVK